MVYCAVYGCKSSNKIAKKQITFHRFPSNTAEALKWLRFCRRADTVNLKNAAICSLHFKSSDYQRNLHWELLSPSCTERRPRLKSGAVPSVELPSDNLGCENNARIRKKYLQEEISDLHSCQDVDGCNKYDTLSSTFSNIFSKDKVKKEYSNQFSPAKNHVLRNTVGNTYTYDSQSGELSSTIDSPEDGDDDYPTVCLVCDVLIKDSAAVCVHDLFLESSVTTHSRQQVVVMLAVLIDTPLTSAKAYSKALCHRCFNLLDDLDDIQQQTSRIKSSITGLYAQSLQNRKTTKTNLEETELLPEKSSISTHDHQYIKPIEQITETGLESIQEFSNAKSEERIAIPFDRHQWRKEEAKRDSIRRKMDPLYMEAVRKGWRERKAKQRRNELNGASKQTVVQTDNHTHSDYNVFSGLVSDQVGSTMQNVIEIIPSHITRSTTLDSQDVQTNQSSPIKVKVFKRDSAFKDLNRNKIVLQPKVKRQYRRASQIVHKCKFCLEVCETGKELKRHQKTHTSIECKFCGKILLRIGAWENHLKAFHNVDNDKSDGDSKDIATCNICCKQFVSQSVLRYHSKLHDGKLYSCEKCNKLFNHPRTLKNHQVIHREKSYTCEKCGKGYRTNFELVMHDNQTHRKARSWKCQDCNKTFARCSVFREHLRLHRQKNIQDMQDSIGSLEADTPASIDVVVTNDINCTITDSQYLNDDNVIITNHHEMLDVQEVVVSEEAIIEVNESQSICNDQNNVLDSESGVYVQEFVIMMKEM